MRIYIMWYEGGWGDSGFVSAAGINKENLIKKDDSIHGGEIVIYDSETCQEIETCHKLINYTDGHKCKCSECEAEK
ncbi:MAG TPA: hypothetical protein ENI23_12875 [bacterium]|nr:hypothetical protein [bacterium]